jgi:hypothetical protein
LGHRSFHGLLFAVYGFAVDRFGPLRYSNLFVSDIETGVPVFVRPYASFLWQGALQTYRIKVVSLEMVDPLLDHM